MSSMPLWGYAVVLAVSLVLSLILTPLSLATALHFGVLDHPGPTKSHTTAVPYLGGAAIVISFAVVVMIAVAVRPPSSGLEQLVAFLGLAVALAVLGLIDDIYRGLSPLLRIAVEAGAGYVIWLLGDSAHLAGTPGWLNGLITVLWIVGVTNAFNLLDNMDGLSAGIATLAALSIFAIACLQHRFLVASLSIALAGCAIGFLRHNFHPAKIYMGDAGSLFLGFMISVLLLKLRAQPATRVDIAVILAIPVVALFDTGLVVVSRLINRRNPFLGGKDHTSHRLVRMGRSVHGAVALIYGAGVLGDGSAIFMSELGRPARIIGVVGIVVAAACAAIYLGRIKVYEAHVPVAGSTDAAPSQPIGELDRS